MNIEKELFNTQCRLNLAVNALTDMMAAINTTQPPHVSEHLAKTVETWEAAEDQFPMSADNGSGD